jgi:hypothetical protein
MFLHLGAGGTRRESSLVTMEIAASERTKCGSPYSNEFIATGCGTERPGLRAKRKAGPSVPLR